MKRLIVSLVALLLLLAGAVILFYPHVQQQLYRHEVRGVISEFEARLEQYRAASDYHWALGEAYRAAQGIPDNGVEDSGTTTDSGSGSTNGYFNGTNGTGNGTTDTTGGSQTGPGGTIDGGSGGTNGGSNGTNGSPGDANGSENGTNGAPGGTNNQPGSTNDPPGGTNDPPGGTNDPPGGTNNPPGGTNNPPGGTNNPPGGTNNPPGGTNNPPGGTNNPPGGANNPPGGGNGQSDDPLHWLYLMKVAHNQRLYESGQADLVDPFSYQQVDFSLREFGFEEEMIAFLTIPRMNTELPIYLGASYENLLRGAAHLTQTSLPVGGINTNSVISAHRGLSRAAMFRDIERLEIGDEIIITNFFGALRYAVTEIRIIEPHEVSTVLIQSGRDLITLLTCHPYRVNTQRLIVIAERV